MKRAKMFLIATALMIISVFYAETSEKVKDLNALSIEIEQMLNEFDYGVEKGSTVSVFFSISEDKTIQFVNVASSNPEVDNFLQNRLEGRAVDPDKWNEGKIYELAIEVPGDTALSSSF